MSAYHVFNPDLPGFGGEPPIPFGFDGPVASVADDIARRMAEAGCERAVLAGYSIGATVAIAVAARHPGAVSGLVLAAGGAKWGGGLRSLAARAPHLASGALKCLALRELARIIDDPSELAVVRDMFGRADGQSMAELLREALTRDFTGFCPSIECPVLIIAGERDHLADRTRIEATASALPNATVIALSGAGHYLCVTHAQFLAEKIAEFGDIGRSL